MVIRWSVKYLQITRRANEPAGSPPIDQASFVDELSHCSSRILFIPLSSRLGNSRQRLTKQRKHFRITGRESRLFKPTSSTGHLSCLQSRFNLRTQQIQSWKKELRKITICNRYSIHRSRRPYSINEFSQAQRWRWANNFRFIWFFQTNHTNLEIQDSILREIWEWVLRTWTLREQIQEIIWQSRVIHMPNVRWQSSSSGVFRNPIQWYLFWTILNPFADEIFVITHQNNL